MQESYTLPVCFLLLCYNKCGGEQVRMSGSDLETHLSVTEALNAEFNAELVTEFPFNGLGILEKVTISVIENAFTVCID